MLSIHAHTSKIYIWVIDANRIKCALQYLIAEVLSFYFKNLMHLLFCKFGVMYNSGQESAGIVTGDGTSIYQHKGMGLVSNVFKEEDMKLLKGYMGIGHNRYSTMGASKLVNCQPFAVDTAQKWIAVAHNGELVNAKSLRDKILASNVGLSTKSDSELITQLLSISPPCGEPEGG